MDTRINLSQLAKALTSKRDMSQKDAEAFLREFFDAIIQNVTTDKLVKIKGLGTFKLIEVLDRESINVNTGERIVIPGHTKLSFTPDTSLKDMVNKPFADFQTVVINEGTSLEEMEKIPQEEQLEMEPEPAPEPEPTSVSTPEPMIEPETETKSETKTEVETETKETEEEVFVLGQIEGAEATPDPYSALITPSKNNAFTTVKKWMLLLGVVLLVLLSYFIGYHHMLNPSAKELQKEEIEEEAPEQGIVEDLPTPTIKGTAPVAENSSPLPQEEQSEEIYAQVRGGNYVIIGTRKTRVMESGDYLTKIALEEYGDKEFTRYIIVHNRFPDPNNVPVGAEIKLPELKKKE